MLWKLVLKEIKYQFKTITIYVFFGVIFLFYFSQFGIEAQEIYKPDPGSNDYGVVEITDEYEEMSGIYIQLKNDLLSGEVGKYTPLYKTVKLTEQEKSKLVNWLMEIAPTGEIKDAKTDIKVGYDRFIDIIHSYDDLMGGNTVYNDENRHSFRGKTYEEALQEYKDLKNKDKFTNGSARLFVDYLGITAGLFPIFIAAFVLLRDKKSRANELINSSKISSIKYVFSKYIAVCICVMLGYLVLATFTTIKYMIVANKLNLVIDNFAFLKYTITWITPTVLFTVAMGMLLSIIFNNAIIGIVVQAIICYKSLMPLEGDYSLTKNIIRFNSLGNHENYIYWRNTIITNRLFFTGISLVMVMATVYLWSIKRKDY
ncbi:ABC transporter permease [Clostridium grantii]|uniref:ABC-2 family transporter protein n=1 Tax=Clostridium grantii DSM 8605 TaxID=1121316 RepID=A0A1M5WTG1_9CLOT|nr:ABC transporter permease [Clostridium grantii]SHH90839.1 ABC-2 family transporter protein [Clostridium grantii DSM 8605]